MACCGGASEAETKYLREKCVSIWWHSPATIEDLILFPPFLEGEEHLNFAETETSALALKSLLRSLSFPLDQVNGSICHQIAQQERLLSERIFKMSVVTAGAQDVDAYLYEKPASQNTPVAVNAVLPDDFYVPETICEPAPEPVSAAVPSSVLASGFGPMPEPIAGPAKSIPRHQPRHQSRKEVHEPPVELAIAFLQLMRSVTRMGTEAKAVLFMR